MKKKQNAVDTTLYITQRGITLVALVITIIVLLILAGVTINLTLGENGIFKTAQTAVQNYTNAQEKELAELAEFNNTLNDTIGGQNTENSNNEKTITLNGSWSDKNKVNMPKLVNTGLTPVTISSDGTYGTPDIQAENWYSYDGTTNKWANAQTKDGSMWVWIPRFAYKITYTDANDKSQGGTIDVVFLKGTTNLDANGNDVTSSTYVDEKNTTGAYIVHPAFQDGSSTGYTNGEWDSEIEGFWMAKFEAGYVGTQGDASTAIDSPVTYSTTDSWTAASTKVDLLSNYYGERAVGTPIKYPTFQANRPSMNFIGISDAYDLCMSIKDASNVYGLSNIDSHLPKNSEWGAVAYLAKSKYGRNGVEITENNVSLNNTNTVYAVTGYGGETINAGSVYTTLSAIENGTQEGSWTTEQGQKASSTGNIYGIYDLSGGAREWTAACIIGNTENYEKYVGSLKGDSNQYKTKYAGTSSSGSTNHSESENQARKGDAITETSSDGVGSTSWDGNDSKFFTSNLTVANRGGYWGGKTLTGIFSFNYGAGMCDVATSFRPILIAN